MKHRVMIEIEYLIALIELPLPQLKGFNHDHFATMRSWFKDFSATDANKIKDFEKVTNHDVKAVEYFVKAKMDENGLHEHKEFVHFGLTSQDINNTAIPFLLKDFVNKDLLPKMKSFTNQLRQKAEGWIGIAMLSRTHGQPATPTLLGKEIMVFVERLDSQIAQLAIVPFTAKFGGAIGNLNAHYVAYPDIDWIAFANTFVSKYLGLDREQFTTQIGHYDNIGSLCDASKRINTVLLDFSKDMWTYISMDYFHQTINPNEVGSSAMPHKVNPIDFENAEGNLGIANCLFEHLAGKLPVSRLQRDLTDSTVLRNLGVPFAHMMLSHSSLVRGMGKVHVNQEKLHRDLDENWAVIAEPIQTILRRENYPEPYEALKKLTRVSHHITRESLMAWVDNLQVSESVKSELRSLSPHTYTGIVAKRN
eukprot:TRINITY_DN13362_c0_g1_i1.p1 TRINITY_DN13362_c0_g1~~TRINITY_DN13362_c0_g1_i1.p1  ORF type:complete len:472 (-),score=129.20 TRINITY_DN13362_c0_g1_i1:113-1375(-)